MNRPHKNLACSFWTVHGNVIQLPAIELAFGHWWQMVFCTGCWAKLSWAKDKHFWSSGFAWLISAMDLLHTSNQPTTFCKFLCFVFQMTTHQKFCFICSVQMHCINACQNCIVSGAVWLGKPLAMGLFQWKHNDAASTVSQVWCGQTYPGSSVLSLSTKVAFPTSESQGGDGGQKHTEFVIQFRQCSFCNFSLNTRNVAKTFRINPK